MHFLGGLLTAGHSSDYQTGAIGRVAAYEHVLGIFGVFGLQEAHGQQTELGLDDFRLTLLDHDGTTAVGIGFPIDFLYFHTSELPVLTQELQGVDVPSSRASLFVRRGGLEGAGGSSARDSWGPHDLQRAWA